MAKVKQAGEGQYLTFRLSEEIYALEITKVREVLDNIKITKVPQTPKFVKGIINLRGGVVPVVDLRLKFGMEETQQTVDTCIIIVEITIDGDISMLGALADKVQEVVEIDNAEIMPPPKIGLRLNTDFIRGMGKQKDEFIIILDIEKVFSLDELELVQATSGLDVPAEVHSDENGE